jgi:hypothetical protein
MKKMRLFGVKLLTHEGATWFNQAKLGTSGSKKLPKAPFRVEGKEFLLTRDGQSVMNIFTASSFSGNFCV